MSNEDNGAKIEMADGAPLPTDAPPAATGHPGEKLDQPVPADPIPVRAEGAAADGEEETGFVDACEECDDPAHPNVVSDAPRKRGMCTRHASVKLTAEQHAKRLGHLPAYHVDAPPADKPKKVMPRRPNPNHTHYLEAKNANGWPIGKELTRAEYLAGVDKAKKLIFR